METITIEPSTEGISALSKLGEVFALDTETTSLKLSELRITGISLCDGKINIYVPFYEHSTTKEQEGFETGKRKTRDKAIQELLLRAKKIIFHNYVFDKSALLKEGFSIPPTVEIEDTMIMSHLLDENRPCGLKYLTETLFNTPVAHYDERLSHFSKEFFKYALADSLNTYMLYELFERQMYDEGLRNLYKTIEIPFQEVLVEMRVEGVLVDEERLLNHGDTLLKELLSLKQQMYNELGCSPEVQLTLNKEVNIVDTINFNSSKQLAEILYKDLGLYCTSYTDKGALGTNYEALIAHSDHPFVRLLLKYKAASKLYSAFISVEGQVWTNIESDGKVRPNFLDVGTRTGRLSCSRPNLQQIPNSNEETPVAVREIFIAPKGYKMLTCDYSGQEVAVAAQVSKDPTLVESLNKGYDMHLAIANQFYSLGIPEECLSTRHKDYNNYKEKFSEERRRAKVITFGLMYGKGAYGFAKDFSISEAEAEKIVSDYFAGMPQLKQAIDDSHKALKEQGEVTSLAGRKRRFKKESYGDYSGSSYRQCFNFLIQGFSADMIRAAAVTVNKNKIKYPQWGLKAIMTVHDEIGYIVKEEYVDNAKNFIKKCFESVGKNFIVPVKADVGIGDNYEEAK